MVCVYFGFDLVAAGYGVNVSSLKIQILLGIMKEKLGISDHVPYLVAGGKLIFILEKSQVDSGRVEKMRMEKEFEGSLEVKEIHEKRELFRGRQRIQVGIAKMSVPGDNDFSRELAHAEMLWDMIK